MCKVGEGCVCEEGRLRMYMFGRTERPGMCVMGWNKAGVCVMGRHKYTLCVQER